VILFSSFLIATFVTMALIPPLMRAATRLGFVDRPGPRKLHGAAVPRIGGVAMATGAVLPLVIWLPFDHRIAAVLLGIALIVAFGAWDDRRDLDYRTKFIAQLIAVGVVIAFGDVTIRFMPFISDGPLPDIVAIPLTVIALLGITNAINLADGLDGLAGGTMLLSVGAIGILAYAIGNHDIALIAAALIGSILGFLRFNTHPARVFMGDSGSQFLGLTAGILAISLTQTSGGTLSPALPLLLLGLPILDTLLVMGQRICQGRSPFSADCNHVHHKLLSLGFDHYEAVSLIYLVQAGLVVGAYLLRFQSDVFIVATYAVVCLVVTASLLSAGAMGWRAHRALADGAESALTVRLRSIQRSGRIEQWAVDFAACSLPIYYVASLAIARAVTADIGMLAAILFATLLTLWARNRDRPFTWVERGGAYLVGAVMLYLPVAGDAASHWFFVFSNMYFILLAAAVVAGLILSSDDRRFRVTPLDLLVVFIALVAPNLPGTRLAGVSYGIFVAELIVLFYALELVLSDGRSPRRAVRLAHLAATFALGVHAMV
jgi:UDP-GlcNAc:undecaprenyl-phosphate GlcNAc-1-phosphate transferase